MTLIGTCITEANHAEWLAERAQSVGASESATVLGLNRYETALQLYLTKIGAMPPAKENRAMRLGKLMEPVLAALYREETGREFACFQRFVKSPVHDWMTATLDGVREDGRIVEFKNVGAENSAEWGESGTDEVPPAFLIQGTHQMICSGTEVLDFAALIGGREFRWYTVERDDRIADRIVEATGEFMRRVRRREPPPVDPARDAAAMSRLWPRAEGEIDLGPIGRTLVEEWEEHGREARRHGDARERCSTQILDIMQDAATARIGDGRTLVRKLVKVGEKQITRNAYEFVSLRISNPNRGQP